MIGGSPGAVNGAAGRPSRRLGRTELLLSPLGLGTWAFGGGDWAFGWGPQDDEASRTTLRTAVSLGLSWIDTAPVYGLGRAEEIVGSALRDLPASERPLVFTKCGLPWKKRKIRHSLKAASIRGEVEGSLKRLGVAAIDLLQIHWPGSTPGGPAPEIEEGFETLVALREEGKVREVGVCNLDVAELERIRKINEPASLQPPYSLLRREAERELFPYCREHGIGVLAYSPMASGLLTGKMTRERIQSLPANDWRRSKSEDFREPRLTENLERVERLRRVAIRHGCTPGEVAVAWTLRHPAVTGAIVGARRPGQIEEISRAAELVLGEEDLEELNPTFPS